LKTPKDFKFLYWQTFLKRQKEPDSPKGLKDAWEKLPLFKQVLNMPPKMVSKLVYQQIIINPFRLPLR